MTSTSRIIYDERLTVPKTWWVIAALFGISLALVLFPYGPVVALIALAIGTCLACMYVSSQGSTRIRVTGDTLFVADARIPRRNGAQPGSSAQHTTPEDALGRESSQPVERSGDPGQVAADYGGRPCLLAGPERSSGPPRRALGAAGSWRR
ncbi:DUF3093 family protein [Streptomyces sp. NPDC057623]|uniref:DUF3093 family protein n=1 Tax=Streptomyces sp. NPDC057623 TaxID=3346187 RepID=UPI0036CAEAF9